MKQVKSKKCKVCGSVYFKLKTYKYCDARWKKSKYCSKKCRDKGMAVKRGPYLGQDKKNLVIKLAKMGLLPHVIAKKTGVSRTSVQRYAIHVFEEKRKEKIKLKNKIREHYKKGLNSPEIAKIFNISSCTVRNICKDIMRTQGQSIRGNRNPAWKNGRTKLKDLIRKNAQYNLWRKTIFERDNYICQICKRGNNKLNVDHIKPFVIILIENNIDSLEKAMRCKELWDIKNGRTLCKECHKKTETYGWKMQKKLINIKK